MSQSAQPDYDGGEKFTENFITEKIFPFKKVEREEFT